MSGMTTHEVQVTNNNNITAYVFTTTLALCMYYTKWNAQTTHTLVQIIHSSQLLEIAKQ